MRDTYRPNGTRWKYLKQHTRAKHRPYDYEDKGLLVKLLPSQVINTDNTTTKATLAFVEDVLVRMLRYIDVLRYFKDWNYRQY